jgi:hypothetical protein
MSQTVLFTPISEQDDYFTVLTESGTSAKIFKTVLPDDVIDRFRTQSNDSFYGKSISSDTLILLE